MELYKEVEVKTRKPHRCAYCCVKIEVGSIVRKESGKADGDFFTRYVCEECMPFTGGFWRYMDNECGDIVDDFAEWRGETR